MPLRRRASALKSVSITSDDLPPPDTPVIQVKVPSGKSTLTFCRLFSFAPEIDTFCPLWPGRRSFGISICLKPVRYCPVKLSEDFIMSSGVPMAMILPPCMPAPGPISTTKSAERMASSSCSTTMTVFPRSRRRFSVSSRRLLSR